MTTETLKACPLCGEHPPRQGSVHNEVWCANHGCPMSSNPIPREWWDTRPTEATLKATIDGLVEAAGEALILEGNYIYEGDSETTPVGDYIDFERIKAAIKQAGG